MNRNIGTVGSIAALLLGSSVVFADHNKALEGEIEIPSGSAGYLSSMGNGIRTGINRNRSVYSVAVTRRLIHAGSDQAVSTGKPLSSREDTNASTHMKRTRTKKPVSHIVR